MNRMSVYQRLSVLNLLLILLTAGVILTINYWIKTYGIGATEIAGSIVIFLVAATFINRWQKGMIKKSINELRIKQDRAWRMEKLTAVSHLGAGIADRIRNPLTSIKGFSFLLQNRVKANERCCGYTNIILHEVNKIERIINNFLLLSTPPHPFMVHVNINRLIDEMLPPLVNRAILQKIKITTVFDDRLPVVQADAGQIKHVIGNLAANAIDAMPDGGHLKIETIYTGGVCNILISDTGIGISPENIEKVAEPFYTTKDEGIGLGLTVSQQIIVNHNGTLDIEARKNAGTTFRIKLPAARAGSQKDVPA